MARSRSSKEPRLTSLASSLASLPAAQRERWIAGLTDAQALQLRWHWPFWARPEQLAPEGAWRVWLILAGRGWGKTKTGAEWVRGEVDAKRAGRIALVGATAADVRDVMVEGPSGLIATAPPWARPTYEPSKRRVTWPNGAIATTYSADEPDRLRGPQHDIFWADELAAWRYAEAWDQLSFGLRMGTNPRGLVSTTPRPTRLVKQLLREATTRVTRGSTYDNRDNLAPAFLTEIVKRYEGTRMGRQELDGQVLEDTPGALWTHGLIDAARVTSHPTLQRVVVAVDPSVADEKTEDQERAEAGIVVAGIAPGEDGRLHGYVLDDLSLEASPDAWGRRAVRAYQDHRADRVVAETNNGGALVESLLRTIDAQVAYKAVHASRGKLTRAEPVAALYEQGRVHHVGSFPQLEDQLCTYAGSGLSPDRFDALVWALTELLVEPQAPSVDVDGTAIDGGGSQPSGWV